MSEETAIQIRCDACRAVSGNGHFIAGQAKSANEARSTAQQDGWLTGTEAGPDFCPDCRPTYDEDT